MPADEAREWARQQLDQGVPRDQVADQLVAAGHHPTEVRELLDDIESEDDSSDWREKVSDGGRQRSMLLTDSGIYVDAMKVGTLLLAAVFLFLNLLAGVSILALIVLGGLFYAGINGRLMTTGFWIAVIYLVINAVSIAIALL